MILAILVQRMIFVITVVIEIKKIRKAEGGINVVEIVIKIPEGLKNDFELEQWTALSCMEMKNALEKAIPLPKGHGRIVDIDEAIKYIEDLNGEDGIWVTRLINWACSKRTIVEAESEE